MAGVQGGGRRAGAGVRPDRRRACAVAGGATQRPRVPGIPLSGAQRRPAGRGARVPVRELAGRAFHHRSPPGRSERLARGRWLGPRVQAWAGVGRAGGAARARPRDSGRAISPLALWSWGIVPGLVDRPGRAKLEHDFERFKRALPPDFAAHVRAAYRIDLTGRYAGEPLPHPIGKGSGQLSLNAGQLEEDAAAGLAFVVLKTVIAEDDAGVRAMAAWAIHETRMRVERRAAADGRPGWTVTWKSPGWDRTLGEYVALGRRGRDPKRARGAAGAAAGAGADALVCFNRLFDAERGVAYGGWDLSERNLRVLETSLTPGASPGFPGLTGTGNICSGRMILDYARRGCESLELHTFF